MLRQAGRSTRSTLRQVGPVALGRRGTDVDDCDHATVVTAKSRGVDRGVSLAAAAVEARQTGSYLSRRKAQSRSEHHLLGLESQCHYPTDSALPDSGIFLLEPVSRRRGTNSSVRSMDSMDRDAAKSRILQRRVPIRRQLLPIYTASC
jgi:hypothetical protein